MELKKGLSAMIGISQIGDGRKSRNVRSDGRRREIKIALDVEDEEEGL